MKKIFKTKYRVFIFVYALILVAVSAFFLLKVRSLLKEFENAQPERIVEQQIELLSESALRYELEKVLPMSDEMKTYLGSEKYPSSFVETIADGGLTYKQKVGSYGAGETAYSIMKGDKELVTVNLSSSNTRTEMIVFTCADWSLDSIYANKISGSFTVPDSVTVKVNGKVVEGSSDENGNKAYSMALLADSEIEFIDIFGNSEKQKDFIRKKFATVSFTVPSNFEVTIDGIESLDAVRESRPVSELGYVAEYTEVPTLMEYNISYIPSDSFEKPTITVKDNLGRIVPFPEDDVLEIREQATLPEVPAQLLKEANVLAFAENWSLFMTNDLSGGLATISKSLIKDSYLYDVAYKWATGIDRTFTSIHRLYNPPFEDEKIYNFVQYSDSFFSCDVHLVKKMRIANGLDVDDVLSKRLYFVKYDATDNGKDDPKWYVADMIGTEDETAVNDGGEKDE